MPTSDRRNLIEFLLYIDANVESESPVGLYLGGGAAMVLAYGGQLATTDVDFIGSRTGLLASLCELAGAESDIHETTGYYLDVIPAGLFPQASAWRKRATRVHIPGTKRIELKVLELHDLILSKLRRFLGKDRQDIKALCDRSGFDIHVLRARYRDARLIYDYDEREAMDRNFRFIETEFLALEPTPDFD